MTTVAERPDTEVQSGEGNSRGRGRPLPDVELPRPPSARVLWNRALVLAWILVGLFLVDRLALAFMELWLYESLGFRQVFWTNFWAGAVVYVVINVGITTAVAVPAWRSGLSKRAKTRAVALGLLLDEFAGWHYYHHFREFLLFLHAQAWGKVDPVFHHDIGFYVFKLPAILTTLRAGRTIALAGLASAILCAWIGRDRTKQNDDMGRISYFTGVVATPLTIGFLTAFGLFAAATVWLSRYGLLIKHNYASSIPAGAEALDITGFFSTKHAITVETLAILGGTFGAVTRLRIFRRASQGRLPDWRRRLAITSVVLVFVPGLVLDFGFKGLVAIRNMVAIQPNEALIQLPYIKRHIDATNTAWGLDKVERLPWSPKSPGDPLPDLDKLLASPEVQNAQLWPGAVAWLERQVDPEYLQRVFLTGDGSTQIYGTTLDTFKQQQKLRPYYDFMDVDTVRYEIDGKDKIVNSAVRELPLNEPQPWLAWWGQRFVLFTHGYGLVMNSVNNADANGEPVYASKNIPSQVSSGELKQQNPSIYYGEGSGSMAFSNLHKINEFDHPTDNGRAEVSYPKNVKAGVRIDSLLKRIVLGYKSRSFFDITFSHLIKSDVRVHYYRTPIERVQRLAPFLYYDTDPYAVTGAGSINWMINGMTTTTNYPYSMRGDLGDKSIRRSPTVRPVRVVNYAADSVKATVNAYTGATHFYKIADEPVVNTWAKVYPSLFTDGRKMPGPIRQQRQYPPQLFHVQFDDLYIYYHQKDPLTFFNQEDAFDDADELLGPMLTDGRAITFSFEPYYWEVATGNDLPAANDDDKQQFSMSMIFTPESAKNLRSIATVYMDGDDYGRLNMLEIPKGTFFQGPEQAEAAIDQDAFISQQIGFWNKLGTEVIRGHMTPLVVGGELIYIEPMFIRSVQNQVPQLKRVVVVMRGQPFMGSTLEEALTLAIKGGEGPGLTTGSVVDATAKSANDAGGPPPDVAARIDQPGSTTTTDPGPPPGKGKGQGG